MIAVSCSTRNRRSWPSWVTRSGTLRRRSCSAPERTRSTYSLIDGPVRLVGDHPAGDFTIEATPRIGISRATLRPWRFVARYGDGSSLAPT